MTSTMEASSTTSRSQSSGLSSPRLKPPPLGSTSSSRWMVLASRPVASVMRLAARPVGAHSRSLTSLAARMRRIALTMVVLPTPGPPVMTSTLDASASRTAGLLAFGEGKSDPFLDPGQSPCLASIQGQGSVPFASRISRSAIGLLGPMQAGQKYAGRFADTVGDDRALCQFEIKGRARSAPPGPQAASRRAARSSSVGKPQWPSSIASVSA